MAENINKIPKLTFSFTVEPSSLSVSGDKLVDYKKFANNVFFGFTVGINIPLSPFDDPYDVNRIVKELSKLNYFEYQILYAKHKSKEDEHRLNLTILKEVYLLAE